MGKRKSCTSCITRQFCPWMLLGCPSAQSNHSTGAFLWVQVQFPGWCSSCLSWKYFSDDHLFFLSYYSLPLCKHQAKIVHTLQLLSLSKVQTSSSSSVLQIQQIKKYNNLVSILWKKIIITWMVQFSQPGTIMESTEHLCIRLGHRLTATHQEAVAVAMVFMLGPAIRAVVCVLSKDTSQEQWGSKEEYSHFALVCDWWDLLCFKEWGSHRVHLY